MYISAKPFGDTTLSASRKAALVELLDDRNTVTIEPVFVDAEYLYVVPSIEVRYNPAITNKDGNTLLTQIDGVMSTFNTNDLGVYDSNFYLSEFLKKVDAIDSSVVNVAIDLQMQRRFIPNTTITQAYQVNFNNPIYNPHAGHKYAISSSSFTYNGFTCYFDDDGDGKLRIYRIVSGKRVAVVSNAGVVNYTLGSVRLYAAKFTAFAGDGIKINAVPAEHFVKSIRSQICQLADATVNIINSQTDSSEVFSRSVSSTAQATVLTETGVVSSTSTY